MTRRIGRPPVYGKERISTGLRLLPELHERLLNEARARDVSLNCLCERLLSEGIERLIPVEELTLTRRNGVA